MAEQQRQLTLGELAKTLGGELRGPADLVVGRPVPAGVQDPSGITFAASEKYIRQVLESPSGSVIVPLECPPIPVPAIAVSNPRAAFGHVLAMFERRLSAPAGIHPTAVVDPSATVDPSASVGAYCVVEAEAVIAAGAQVLAHSFVGPRTVVGEHTILMPRTTLYQDVEVGKRCIIHSGAVVGADGFGFVFDGEKQAKVPQVGRVLIEDDVEVGANTCIDRATCGDTVVGRGVKLDNLVQIAHNCRVGAHTVMASQVGVSGSVVIGERCVLGGQVGIADHAELGDEVMMAGQSGANGRLEKGQYVGSPAIDARIGFRSIAVFRRLPELQAQVRELARRAAKDENGA